MLYILYTCVYLKPVLAWWLTRGPLACMTKSWPQLETLGRFLGLYYVTDSIGRLWHVQRATERTCIYLLAKSRNSITTELNTWLPHEEHVIIQGKWASCEENDILVQNKHSRVHIAPSSRQLLAEDAKHCGELRVITTEPILEPTCARGLTGS